MGLVFATSNRHKYEEAKLIARAHGLEIEQRNVPYIEIQADDPADIVKPGVQQACALVGNPCIVEDAGLFVRSLGGFPGPYSSYVFEKVGNSGILKLLEGEVERGAEFRSAVGYCEPESEPHIFEGKVIGTIALEKRGSEGFGYDPIFIPDGGEGKTFAEMPREKKNELSHRSEAIEKFVKWYAKK